MAEGAPRPRPAKTGVAIGLGSNLGDRARHLAAGLAALAASGRARVVRRSAFVESAPAGGPPQPAYLNAAAWIETDLEPRELLALCKRIEADEGRVDGPRWGPRPLDLDLLLYGDRVVAEPGLEIPHPRMAGRAFVLEPLATIAPDARHPGVGRTVRELRDALRDSAAARSGAPA